MKSLLLLVTLSLLPSASFAAITNMRMFKWSEYNQEADGTIAGPVFWAFDSNVSSTTAGEYTNYRHTAGTTVVDEPASGRFAEIFRTYPFQPLLEAAFPAGPHTFTVSGGTLGTLSSTLNFPDNYYPAGTPAFTAASLLGLQTFDPSNDLTLHWNQFTPHGDANAPRVRLFAEDEGTHDFPVEQGTLPADATSWTLPGGTLQPGHDYLFMLILSNARSETAAGFGGTANTLVDAYTQVNFRFTAVPEPGAALLSLLTLGSLALRRRR